MNLVLNDCSDYFNVMVALYFFNSYDSLNGPPILDSIDLLPVAKFFLLKSPSLFVGD